MTRPLYRNLFVSAGILGLLLALNTPPAQSSQNTKSDKRHKKRAPKVIVLNSDDLPRWGYHYVMVPPDPPKYASTTPVTAAPNTAPAVPAATPNSALYPKR